jgi:hypothetical protein
MAAGSYDDWRVQVNRPVPSSCDIPVVISPFHKRSERGPGCERRLISGCGPYLNATFSEAGNMLRIRQAA